MQAMKSGGICDMRITLFWMGFLIFVIDFSKNPYQLGLKEKNR
jgi:hypothetical protein